MFSIFKIIDSAIEFNISCLRVFHQLLIHLYKNDERYKYMYKKDLNLS